MARIRPSLSLDNMKASQPNGPLGANQFLREPIIPRKKSVDRARSGDCSKRTPITFVSVLPLFFDSSYLLKSPLPPTTLPSSSRRMSLVSNFVPSLSRCKLSVSFNVSVSSSEKRSATASPSTLRLFSTNSSQVSVLSSGLFLSKLSSETS